MTSNSWYILVNPISGNKFYQRKKKQLTAAFSKLNSEFTIQETAFSGHEEELVEEAIQFGYRKFISVGGDGTLHHVMNGIMKHGIEFISQLKIGVIPIGTGNDWAKHYSIPKNIDKCIVLLNQEKTVFQDIGKLTHNHTTYYFNNIAGLGFDGLVVKQVLSFKNFGKLAYLLASLKSLVVFKKPFLTCNWEENSISSKCYLVAIGVCQYCGGGMRLTHTPNPTDGMFDVTLVKDITKLGFVGNIRKMFNGKLNQHPKVETFKTNKLSVTSKGKKDSLIQADGELIGNGEITVEVIPKAIQFVIPS